ncbi:NADH-quinone oxidoreductase subunit G [Actinomyces minihominis]|uniref:NADH-quinone oxidoreductase subunit G n=1 Tax=Actinomyces minihominis TaxID=2002838 RepID=UPI001F5D1A35|nr:NADH-quinone oxidoreductase subunit G [Actinomyces minihominis]
MVTLSIDGTDVEAPAGTLIIRAAEQVGIRIPRFCDHPLLKPVAACRQCLVEVGTPDREGNLRMMPKPQPSCAIEISPGMVVKTQHTSPVAKKAQVGVMEFLLINHPLDCPICDKGGECPLQNQAMTEGEDDTRFNGAKRVYKKPLGLTTQILLDRDRCILCQRCVRFAKEIPGDPFLDLQGRGGGSSPEDDHKFMGEQVGTFDAEVLDFYVKGTDGPKRSDISGPYGQEGIISSVYAGPEKKSSKDMAGRTFASYFSGNIIQICPVGALTSTTYRFRSRPFDLVSTPSVAEHDASGSAVRIDVRRGEVLRKLSGNDPEVNEEWITDKDRFAFPWYKLQDRLTLPLVREDGKLVPTSWSDAIDRAAKGLAAAVQGGGVGLLPGGRTSFEDAWAWSKFARVVLRTNSIDSRWRLQSDEELGFIGSRVAGRGLGVTYEDVEKAGSALLVALEVEDEIGSLFLRLRKGVTGGTVRVATVAPVLSRGSEKLDATLIPAIPGEEVAALDQIAEGCQYGALAADLAEGGVILVGERAARTPGLFAAVERLAARTGAKVAWVPRRSGDRGAVDAGLLPNLLPFGRPVEDADARESLGWGEIPAENGLSAAGMLEAAASGSLGALVLGGIDLRDWEDPAAAAAAIRKAPFVIALEVRPSEATELADVVFPVAPPAEKNGTFINWEGRLRPFGQSIASRTMPDREVFNMIAREFGIDLGIDDLNSLYEEVNPLMIWRGARIKSPVGVQGVAPKVDPGSLVLASHKVMVDLGRMLDGAVDLRLSARSAVALLSRSSFDAMGLNEDDNVRVTGPRGSVILPVEVSEVVDGVVWIPECSVGNGVNQDLAPAGSSVTVTPAREVAQ